MRWLISIFLVTLIGAAHAAERVVLVHGELLGSDKRALESLKKSLAKRHPAIEFGDATAAEMATANEAFAGKPAAALDAWKQAGMTVVIALEIPLFNTTKEGRFSRGIGSIAVWRPVENPARVVYRELADATTSMPFDSNTGTWMEELLTLGQAK